MSDYEPYYEGGWKNEEDMATTPICAEALNNIENGLQGLNIVATGDGTVTISVSTSTN